MKLQKGSSLDEWLGCSFKVLAIDGSNLLTASQRCDDLTTPTPNCKVPIIRVD